MPAEHESADALRAADGDHEAFERLYRGHVDRIYSLALRMTGEDLAEDLTQEVFIRAWKKLGSFRGDSKFGTWLHRLAVNHILSRRETVRKREARQVTAQGIMERMIAPRRRASAEGLDIESALQTLPNVLPNGVDSACHVHLHVLEVQHAPIPTVLSIRKGDSGST